MRIRILAGRLDRAAGSHVYHSELARRLAARGHAVSLVCFGCDSTLVALAEVCAIPPRPFEHSPFLWRIAPLRQSWHYRGALGSVHLSRPEVIIGGEHLLLKPHARLFPATPWIYLPHALTVTDEFRHQGLPPVLRGTTLLLYRHLQRWALAHASCTVRFTRMASDALTRAYPHRARRLIVNPIGIDVPTVSARPPRAGSPRLLIVGQLIARKGIDIALSALASLKDLPWHLDILGEGPLRAELERTVATLGLEGRVDFAGQVESPARWYSRADLLLFPSRSESLGLVALEAMSYGVPCLAFRADGAQFTTVSEEFIEHSRTGLLVSSLPEFGHALRAALQRPESLGELGRAARATVQSRYSWESHLDRYESLFAELVAAHHSPPQ